MYEQTIHAWLTSKAEKSQKGDDKNIKIKTTKIFAVKYKQRLAINLADTN